MPVLSGGTIAHSSWCAADRTDPSRYLYRLGAFAAHGGTVLYLAEVSYRGDYIHPTWC